MHLLCFDRGSLNMISCGLRGSPAKVGCSKVPEIRLEGLVGPISLEHDVVLSAIPVSAKEFEEPKSPLLISAKRDGIRVA